MAQGLLRLGSFPRVMQNDFDMIWIFSTQRCNKTTLVNIPETKKTKIVAIHKTKKRMRLPDENKEQNKLYKHLVHDYKPIIYINKDKPQEELPQILNKKSKEMCNLGTKFGEINPTAKTALHFSKNKNTKTFSKQYSQRNMAYFIALANLVHNRNQNYDSAHEQPRIENKFSRTNKNIPIPTTVDVFKPQILPERKRKSHVNISHMGGMKSQSKISDIKEIYRDPEYKVSHNFAVTNSNKKGYSFFENPDEKQRLPRDVLEKPQNKNVLVNILVVGDVKPQVKPENYAGTSNMQAYSTNDYDKRGMFLFKGAGRGETLPCDVTEQQRKENSLVKAKVETQKNVALEEGFSLYEDACQIESLPPDALEKPNKQSLRMKETASLMEMVQCARHRSREEYFETCMKSLGVTAANKPTSFPPLGPPPIMFPTMPNMPPLPSCPKKTTKKKNKKQSK